MYSKPHTHITHMLRQCTSIVYISAGEPKINQAGKILPEDNKGKKQRESNEHTKISRLNDVKSSWSQEKLRN